MKKTTIFTRIMIPVLIACLLLPPAVYGIFKKTATQQAWQDAETELSALSAQTNDLADEYLNNQNTKDPEQLRRFLRVVSQQGRHTNGSARILLFASGSSLIYPYEIEEQTRVSPLADEVIAFISRNKVDQQRQPLQIEADGTAYLIHIEPAPIVSDRLTWIVTYCPIASIGTWIAQAGQTVLLLTAIMASTLALITFLIARSITSPLKELCGAAKKISRQDFSPFRNSFSLREPETLRVAMNSMADHLQKADQAQKAFFQNVSHELRTPLMSIGGYAQGIEQGVLSDPKAAARVIMDESQRLTGMVNELLTLSRLDQEAVQPELEPVRLGDVLQSSIARIAGVSQRRGVELEAVPFDQEMMVLGNGHLLELILDNLLSNAIRYARTKVFVCVEETSNTFRLSVTDDGKGIAPEDLPHIFERGYKGKNGHYGVGLAIAAAAAQKCKAKIQVKQAPMRGTVFITDFMKSMP